LAIDHHLSEWEADMAHLHNTYLQQSARRQGATRRIDSGWIYAALLFLTLFLVAAFAPAAPEGQTGLQDPAPQRIAEDWKGNSASFLAPLAQ
jgi:hypothetical protein